MYSLSAPLRRLARAGLPSALWPWRRSAVLWFSGALLLSFGPLASLAAAHAIIIDSSPKQDGTVKPGPESATLTFNTRLETAGCKLTLLTPGGARRVLDLSFPAENKLGADLGELPAGTYRIDWIALSVDGHLTRGRVPFTVAP